MTSFRCGYKRTHSVMQLNFGMDLQGARYLIKTLMR